MARCQPVSLLDQQVRRRMASHDDGEKQASHDDGEKQV
jgi:hypothetical protein